MTEQQIIELITGWILEHRPTATAVQLRPDLDLLRTGVVDSLDYLNIVEFVGGKIGIEIDIAEFEDAQLSTIAGIARQIGKQIR